MAMKGQGADHEAACEPHCPGATTHARGTVLAREVDYLREIGEYRNDDAGNTQELKHLMRLTLPAAPLERRFGRPRLL
jgi:hypothetical protein